MAEIGIGIVGGGYMGKAHSVAFSSVAAVFDTALRPRLEMICASTPDSAEGYRAQYGFARATDDWRTLVEDPKVEAVVIASPQSTHRDIAVRALELGKPVLCEKPLGASLEESQAMVDAAKASGAINMVGFNYIRTPASQYARQLVIEGRIGRVICFRCEMQEDFLSHPDTPGDWRTKGMANGNLGDLSPHIINCARAFMGPIAELCATYEIVYDERGGEPVTSDDQAAILCRFENGTLGTIFSSRVATGRKMGYAYEIDGSHGAIRFDGEDQNALWLYDANAPEAERGFRKILTGPAHPDYLPFCQGPGHGTGYQDQIIIEAKDFLTAIATKTNLWPTFEEALEVNRTIAAAIDSHEKRAWVRVADY